MAPGIGRHLHLGSDGRSNSGATFNATQGAALNPRSAQVAGSTAVQAQADAARAALQSATVSSPPAECHPHRRRPSHPGRRQ